ncbi:MAG: hypothetical protein CMQ22_03580, partial [Gammaproteobacteria bacterium]|nr:hypothetical protein [Gammaproteobacteria bacterium]
FPDDDIGGGEAIVFSIGKSFRFAPLPHSYPLDQRPPRRPFLGLKKYSSLAESLAKMLRAPQRLFIRLSV